MPAHYCGVFGHMASYGLIPGRGHARPGQLAPSDITFHGPLARSAADLSLVLPLLAGPDDTDGADRRSGAGHAVCRARR